MASRTSDPRCIGFAAMSIDGRISLYKNRLPNWTSGEDTAFFQDALARMDAVVVGRNTYNAAKARLRTRTTYVLSRNIKRIITRGSVTFLNPARADMHALLARHKTIAILGGCAVYGLMIALGMLDEMYITIEPLVFGRGREMISELKKSVGMKLLSCRQLNKNGTLLLHYTIL